MPLKASELANQMSSELPDAFHDLKGGTFPGPVTVDAKVMFLAIARGLLKYLETPDGRDAIESITTGSSLPGSSQNVLDVSWKTNTN